MAVASCRGSLRPDFVGTRDDWLTGRKAKDFVIPFAKMASSPRSTESLQLLKRRFPESHPEYTDRRILKSPHSTGNETSLALPIFAGRPSSRSDIIVIQMMRDPARRDFRSIFSRASKRKWTTFIIPDIIGLRRYSTEAKPA